MAQTGITDAECELCDAAITDDLPAVCVLCHNRVGERVERAEAALREAREERDRYERALRMLANRDLPGPHPGEDGDRCGWPTHLARAALSPSTSGDDQSTCPWMGPHCPSCPSTSGGEER